MTRARLSGLFLLLLSSGISVFWSAFIQPSALIGITDFKGVYYGARCLIDHRDPYMESEMLRFYLADGGEHPSDPNQRLIIQIVALQVYPPTTYIFISPFAMLPWRSAQLLWMILTAGGFTFAALLVWNLGTNYAPALSCLLIGFMLANSEVLFAGGNPAGIAIGLCVAAVWCFLEERFVPAGILCLAASLAIKPHDTGLVWLYFLLAGGVYRKRALQTLIVAVVLGLASILWVSQIAPHWMPELHANLLKTSAPGGLSDPGPASISQGTIIDLQSIVSVFRDDSRIYNPVTYLVCGALMLVWLIRTLRLHFSQRGAWLALAAVVPLTMLLTYHRPHDAKLLLLTVPACAILWAEGGPRGWIALLVNAAGIVLTADIPIAILLVFAKGLHLPMGGLWGKILTLLLLCPASLILLVMGIFYLWVYVRPDSDTGPDELADKSPG